MMSEVNMEIRLPENTTFPMLVELEPDIRLSYAVFDKMLEDTGVKWEEMYPSKGGNVLKTVVRIYNKEQMEKFLPLYFTTAHSGVQSIELSGKQCFKRLPSFVSFVNNGVAELV